MTTTTTPSFTKEIVFDRETRDFAVYVNGNLIGFEATYHAGEIAADSYTHELLSLGIPIPDELTIPATTLDGVCGDCGQTLDSMGLCGCRDDAPRFTRTPECDKRIGRGDDFAGDAWRDAQGGHIIYTTVGHDPNCPTHGRIRDDNCPACFPADHTPHYTLFCKCSAAGVIPTPDGSLCGACWEASGLWRLWKEDSTEFVAELRRQKCRLNEMAERLATYLSRKHGTHLGTDSILAMWQQLLDDGEPPELRYYVVAARQQVVA